MRFYEFEAKQLLALTPRPLSRLRESGDRQGGVRDEGQGHAFY